MEKLITSDEQLRSFIPNIMDTVEGEPSFFDRLSPFLDQQHIWLETTVIGSDGLPASVAWENIARRLVAFRAFADAAPSLDLVLSPNGFGVVSTSELAPASKDRVDRLVSSLRSSADDTLDALISTLRGVFEWRSSMPGILYCGTLIKGISDVRRWHRSDSVMDTFSKVVAFAHQFETEAAASYLGSSLMHLLVSYVDGSRSGDRLDLECATLLPLVRNAESRWIDAHVRNQNLKCPDSHEMWHLLTPVISKIRQLPRIFREYWYPDMGHELISFNNDIPGAFYF